MSPENVIAARLLAGDIADQVGPASSHDSRRLVAVARELLDAIDASDGPGEGYVQAVKLSAVGSILAIRALMAAAAEEGGAL